MVVGRRAESAAVQILPQIGADGGAVEVVAGVNLATQIIVQVRVCNWCHFNLSVIKGHVNPKIQVFLKQYKKSHRKRICYSFCPIRLILGRKLAF